MIRNLLLVFVMVSIAGLGPAVAQSYFLKPKKTEDTKQAESKKERKSAPTLFNAPKPGQFQTRKSASISYREKLALKQRKAQNMAKVRDLQAWKASGRKPSNAEELRAYAQAHRAVSQQVMYKRTEALMAHLEKTGRLTRPGDIERISRQNDTAVKPYRKADTAKNAPTKPKDQNEEKSRYFIKPERDKAYPTKVFTKYN